MNALLKLIAAIVLFAPGIADAQQTPPPIELWKGFTTASTLAEIKAFKATLPKRKVELYSGCPADMLHRHKDGQLVSIIFLGQDREANCYARILADLRHDLGEPELGTTTFGGMIGYGNGGVLDTTSTGTVMIWRQGEKKTKLVKAPGNGYNLIFTIRPDKYIH